MEKKNLIKLGLFIFYVGMFLDGILTFYRTTNFYICLLIASCVVGLSCICSFATMEILED